MSVPPRVEEQDAERELVLRLKNRGYTPGQKELPGLLDQLAGSRDLARAAERALLRAQHPLCDEIARRATAADPSLRARLTRLASRRGNSEPAAALKAFLLECVGDDDARTRRSAAAGLGRMSGLDVVPALSARCPLETHPIVLSELATALGKIGGEEAATSLAQLSEREDVRSDETLRALVERASVICHRSKAASAGHIRLDAAPDEPIAALVHCRPGLEELLRSELMEVLGNRAHPHVAGRGTVQVILVGPPSQLPRCRIMTEFGFLVQTPKTATGTSSAALAELVASEPVWTALRKWTSGAVRYRLAWKQAGKRRKLRWDVVTQAAHLRSALENDPSQSPWEIRLDETPHELIAELVPRYEDRRFAYRCRDIPAASHPTVAAALVRVAEVKSSDVVWDPFVGSGLELCEAWLAARPRSLIGSDTDPNALAAARANLESVGARGVRLLGSDALKVVGIRPTSIVTNPPLGRRVLRGQDVKGTLVQFVRHAADLLAPGGHLTWVSPHPEATLAVAQGVGLEMVCEMPVDLGGIDGTVQRFDKLNAAKGRRGSSRRTAS